jgi:alpha-beta hydrolase superfamily lysophospholipase
MVRRFRQYRSAKKQTLASQSLQRKDKAQYYSRPFPTPAKSPQTALLNSSPVGYDGLSVPIMPKLTVGAAGDKYEQEADRVATQVVQQLNSPVPPVQRDERNDENTVHRQLMEGLNSPVPGYNQNTAAETFHKQPLVQLKGANAGGVAPPGLEESIQREQNRGQALADSIRNPMENAFGADFGGVRIHTDNTADQLNQSMQAKAFTTGQDVFFRQGAYAPQSKGGQELLAHELTHVVQQGGNQIQRQWQADSRSHVSQFGATPDIQAARGKFGRVMSDIAFGLGGLGVGAAGAEYAARNVFGYEKERTDVTKQIDTNGELTDDDWIRPDAKDNRNYDAQPIEIKVDKKYALRGFRYDPKVERNGKAVILLSGSGGPNEKQLEPVANTYCEGGTTVYGIDYRGYGESVDLNKKGEESTPLLSEAGVYKDARRIYDYVNDAGFAPSNIVLHGFSLGGAVASHLAKSLAKENIKLGGLVLHSSIDTAYRQGTMGHSVLGIIPGLGAKGSGGNFDTIDHLKKLAKRDADLPIHFMSGTSRKGDQLALEKTKLQDVKKDKFTNVSSYARAGDHLETDQHVGGNYQKDYLNKLLTLGRNRKDKDKDHTKW